MSQDPGYEADIHRYLDVAIRPWLERMRFAVTIHPNPMAGFGPILTAGVDVCSLQSCNSLDGSPYYGIRKLLDRHIVDTSAQKSLQQNAKIAQHHHRQFDQPHSPENPGSKVPPT